MFSENLYIYHIIKTQQLLDASVSLFFQDKKEKKKLLLFNFF